MTNEKLQIRLARHQSHLNNFEKALSDAIESGDGSFASDRKIQKCGWDVEKAQVHVERIAFMIERASREEA